MNTVIVWTLTFTVLGPVPEHVSVAKYNNKQECMQALEQTKEQYKLKKKTIVGSCSMIVK